jgi:hypothetical protein
VAVTMGTRAVYTATANPSRLALLDPVAVRTRHVVDVPCTPEALEADAGAARVWLAGSCGPQRSVVAAYDAATLHQVWRHYVGFAVEDLAVLDGRVWLAGGPGIVELSGSGELNQVPGSPPGVYSVTADPVHDRLLALTEGPPSRLYVLRADSLAVRLGPLIPLAKPSIAISQGAVWVAGFGTGRHVIRVDPDAVDWQGLTGDQAIDEAGPGAIVSPGRSVIWVGYTDSDAQSCLDPVTGRTLATWADLRGPVASVPGYVYAPQIDQLYRLQLPAGCPG